MSNIYQAMNEVMKQVGYVRKAGKVGSGSYGYSYAGEKDFIKTLRPALVDSGIVVYPAAIRQLNQDTFTTAKGSVMNRDTVVVTYHFHHADSDTGFDVEVTGQGSDSGDKSANKAMTSALKYALRQTFVIETGDDPDKHMSEPQQRNQQPTQASKPNKTRQAMGDNAPIDTTSALFKRFQATGQQKWGDLWDEKRAAGIEYVTDGRTRKSSEATVGEIKEALKLLERQPVAA